MRVKTVGIALGLLLSLLAVPMAQAQSGGHHSAAWYRKHRHSAAWYRKHPTHSAAWYSRHRKHSAAWYRKHPNG